ncbi:MAG: hypothetical protein R3C12_04165 [Planctomycetaceae bacterium]|nr:hypothetical protein [Planctomycetaceae bacterium]
MRFVRYNGQVAIIARNGQELCADYPESDLSDHLGLWFGEVNANGQPIVYTIPTEYVEEGETISPEYRH